MSSYIKCQNCGYYPSREGYNCANCGKDGGSNMTSGVAFAIMVIVVLLLLIVGPLILSVVAVYRQYKKEKSYKWLAIASCILSIAIGVYFFYYCKNPYYGDTSSPDAPLIASEQEGWFYTVLILNTMALLVSGYVLRQSTQIDTSINSTESNVEI